MKKTKNNSKEMSLIDFMERFGTDEQCEEDLFQKRFGEKGEKFICPKCGATHFYKIKGRMLAQCAKCRHQVSMTVATVMEDSKMPIRKWYLAVYLMTINKSGISSKTLQKEIGVTYKTAWYTHKRIAEAMKTADEKYKLEGLVSVDEAFFTGRSGAQKRGRGTNKTKVLVALSLTKNNKPKYLKMLVVNDFKAKTLDKFAVVNIEHGATVQTDGFKAYRAQQVKKNYLHEYEILPADSPESKLKWLHKAIGNCKQIILGTFHGLARTDLQTYLDEFCYRFNRRKIPQLMFGKLVTSLFSTAPLRYYPRAVLVG
jgi:transposase-like protein